MARKPMNPAERTLAALRHREADRIPIDIGGTRVTGIHAEAYAKYREQLGLPVHSPETKIRYLNLPVPGEDFHRYTGQDIESVDPLTAAEETDISAPSGMAYLDR